MKKFLVVVCAIFCLLNVVEPSTELVKKTFNYPEGLPDKFESCGILEIINYGLKKLNNEKFLNLKHLIKLNVTRNDFSVLDGSEFKNLHQLEILSLKLNGISKISPSEFKALHNLREVHLDENNINVIDKSLFNNNVKLAVISLSTNDIEHIHFMTFDNLKNLREIDLSLNSLTSLPQKLFASNLNLEKVNFYRNNIQYIDSKIFDNLPKLTQFDLEFNSCVPSWINPTNIIKLNETIRINCTVADNVQVEWLTELVEELEQEVRKLKKNKIDNSKMQPSPDELRLIHTPESSTSNSNLVGTDNNEHRTQIKTSEDESLKIKSSKCLEPSSTSAKPLINMDYSSSKEQVEEKSSKVLKDYEQLDGLLDEISCPVKLEICNTEANMLQEQMAKLKQVK